MDVDTGAVPELTAGMLSGSAVVTVEPTATVAEVARTLHDADVGAVLVGTAEDPAGVISERDVVRVISEGRDPSAVGAAAVASPDVITVDASSTLDEVAALMMDRWIRHLLVRDDVGVVGIISARDVLSAYASEAGV